MNILKELLDVITQNDLVILPSKKLVLFIYLFICVILFLENAIIPAFLLPGDSLLIIVGILIKKGILSFILTLGLLTISVSLGSWVGYVQGKFLKNNKILKNWLSYLPIKSYQRAYYMFNKHGLCALFIGRFIILIRTILPTIAGILGLSYFRFQLCNWISSFCWVFILIIIGIFLGYSEFWALI